MRQPKKEKNLKLVNGAWTCDLTIQGKRIRQFGGYTKQEARNTLAKLRLEKLDARFGLKKPIAEVSFEEFADEFLDLYCKQNKRSWQRDELSLRSLKAFFKGGTLQSIGPEKIEAFKAQRRTEVSDSSVNRELSCLKTLCSKAVLWGKLETNPAARVKKLKEPPPRDRILTLEESRRLLRAASPDLRPILIVALGTALRRGEILALKPGDLDFTRGLISIRTSKSGKARQVPMSQVVAEALGGLPRRGEYIFHNSETGTHIKDVKTAFNAACRRAKKNPNDKKDPGITGLHFHDLRRTAATWMRRAGADLLLISRILGHSSLLMTQKYLCEDPGDVSQAFQKIGEILDLARLEVDRGEITESATDMKSIH